MHCKSKKNPISRILWEATIGFEPMNQGVADPRLTAWLCRHIYCYFFCDDSNGNRTRVTAVKGRCLNRLTMEPFSLPRLPRFPRTASLSFLRSSSPSRARTYNNSVNSRVLYHWAIEEKWKVCGESKILPKKSLISSVPSKPNTHILYLSFFPSVTLSRPLHPPSITPLHFPYLLDKPSTD